MRCSSCALNAARDSSRTCFVSGISPPLVGCGDRNSSAYASGVRLYNTLSRRLEELPAPPGPVRMYVCGSTVYKRVHVGNARPFVLGMWVKRWLELSGYDVTLVHNITDVDDHIYEEADTQG